jgi:hypothetical protein
MKKRTLALILALALLILAGAATAESGQGSQPQENGTLGQVTQIDGNTITIALASMGGPDGQMPQGNPPSDSSGQTPQDNPSSDSSGQAPQGTPPADSSGQTPQGNPPSDSSDQAPQGTPPADSSGQAPQGNPPADGQGRGFGGSLTLTGETLTFTVTDATQITLRGGRGAQDTQGALSDIQVGSVVTVVLDGEVAASIAVRQMSTATAAEAPAGN